MERIAACAGSEPDARERVRAPRHVDKMIQRIRILFLIAATSLIAGCGGRPDPTLTVVFSEPHGLTAGAPVVYEDMHIGRVIAVEPQEGGTVAVPIGVDEEHRQSLREKMVFWVPAHDAAEPAWLQARVPDADAAPLLFGATVRGADSPLQATVRTVTGNIGAILKILGIAVVVLGILMRVFKFFLRWLVILFGAGVGAFTGYYLGPFFVPMLAARIPAEYPPDLVARCAVGLVTFVVATLLVSRFFRSVNSSTS